MLYFRKVMRVRRFSKRRCAKKRKLTAGLRPLHVFCVVTNDSYNDSLDEVGFVFIECSECLHRSYCFIRNEFVIKN